MAIELIIFSSAIKTTVMKDETLGKHQDPNELSKKNLDTSSFQPNNRTDKDASGYSGDQNLFRNLSKPPQRDMSGKRVDVDDAGFGIEIW